MYKLNRYRSNFHNSDTLLKSWARMTMRSDVMHAHDEKSSHLNGGQTDSFPVKHFKNSSQPLRNLVFSVDK